MLHVLTDEQISPKVSVIARRLCRNIQITTLFEWMDGHFVGSPDMEILREAARQKMTLLSFDLRTIPLVLRKWGEDGINHGGVIFVDDKSISQSDIRGLAHALCKLWRLECAVDWTNRCFFLQQVKK